LEERCLTTLKKRMVEYTLGSQLVPTGSRMSSSKPNMQQAPSTEQYRKMFVAKPGWKLVDSDYSSAELFIAAYLSGDKQLLFAIEQGYDLHSYSSFLIFGQKWLDAGGSAEPVENHLLKKLQTLEKV
jgi:DNA polymerase I-like protein with 3'-5' exonuclease and polymerase domains